MRKPTFGFKKSINSNKSIFQARKTEKQNLANPKSKQKQVTTKSKRKAAKEAKAARSKDSVKDNSGPEPVRKPTFINLYSVLILGRSLMNHKRVD